MEKKESLKQAEENKNTYLTLLVEKYREATRQSKELQAEYDRYEKNLLKCMGNKERNFSEEAEYRAVLNEFSAVGDRLKAVREERGWLAVEIVERTVGTA